MLLVETFPVGPIQANCSVIADLATREAIVLDPGADADKISEIIRQKDLSVKAIVLTHAHVDHILAVREVKEAHGGEICLHPGDRWLYRGLAMQAAMFGMRPRTAPPVDRWIGEGDRIALGREEALVIETPGHSPGSICLEIHDEARGKRLLFSGDTLFCRGIGRTDLWGGDAGAIERSIRERLYTRDPETVVLPGHGPPTTLAEEARENPFVRG